MIVHRLATMAALLALLAGCVIEDGDVVVPGLDQVEGSGTVVTEEFDLDGFDEVELSGVGQVTVALAEAHSVTVEADDNILDVIVVEVAGDTLVLAVRPGTTIDPSVLEFRVEVPELSRIALPGAGNVSVTGWTGPSGEIDVPGAGSVEVTGAAFEDIEVALSGVGSIEMAGTAGGLRLEMPGAGSFDGIDLQVAEAEVTLSGVGSADVWVTERLQVTLSGAGSLRYRGDPSVQSEITGVGSIEPLEG